MRIKQVSSPYELGFGENGICKGKEINRDKDGEIHNRFNPKFWGLSNRSLYELPKKGKGRRAKKYVAVRGYEYYRTVNHGAVRVKVRAHLRRNKKATFNQSKEEEQNEIQSNSPSNRGTGSLYDRRFRWR